MARKKADAPTPEPTSTATAVAEIPEGMKVWTGAFLVPIDKLIFTDWNVNEMPDEEFSELVEEIEKGGFDEPIHLVPSKDMPGFYIVLGGEHRVRACKALGVAEIPAVLKTHLTEADEATVKMWTVKRNHIKGRANVEKYKALERGLSEKHKIAADVARRKMLVRNELLAALKKGEETREKPDGDGDGDDDGKQSTRDTKEEIAKRKKLLMALKNAEEEVLIKSADTVEHGYLFFGQGQGNHLVVNESTKLHGLVKRMVAACKGDSAPVDEFLCAAIENELGKWE